jgi:hypothetical protein
MASSPRQTFSYTPVVRPFQLFVQDDLYPLFLSSLRLIVVCHFQPSSFESALDVKALVCLGTVQNGLVAADVL